LSVGRIQLANETKVYVINPKKTSDPRRIIERTLKPAPETNSGNGGRSRTEPDGNRSPRAASLSGVIFSDLLGPLAILTTRQGRESKFWVALAAASAGMMLSLLFGWNHILAGLGEKGFVIVPLMLLMSMSILVGFTVWARAVYLLGGNRALFTQNLPDPLKRPGLVGALGFLVPGLGLLVTGHHRRAAFTVWLTGLFALSIFCLSRAAWLWSWNRGAGSDALRGATLENLFIIMGITAAFGTLVWIVQALDGARLAERRFVRNANPSGNATAFVLLASLVIFVLMFEPASIADTLDRFAVSAEYEGYRLLPLHAELAAMRLDPSKPAFAIRAAELYDGLGRNESAQNIREEMFERWKPCIGVLRQHGMLDRYADSETDVLDSGTDAGSPEYTRAVAAEPVQGETSRDPWDRIRSEYGLFTPPFDL
jgi:hypothetical protein